MNFYLVQVIIPLGICVALPVLIVWIIFHARVNSDNKRAQVLIEAIKAENNIDTDALIQAMNKPRRTPRERLYNGLLWGCIMTLVGIAVIVCRIVAGSDGAIDSDECLFFTLCGLVCLAIGVSRLIVFFMSRKHILAEESVEPAE